ncbi:MAG: histidine kinase dimerization/phospho-acceptor domain-containing protein [Rudaea sp.]
MNDAARAPSPRLRLSLRLRVVITFAGLGLVVSVCVALVALYFSDAYVHRLADEMLRVESEYLRGRYLAEGRLPSIQLRHFDVYVTPAHPPPPQLAALAPGLHEVAGANGEAHVAVYPVGSARLYVVFDIGQESARERHLARDLIALVLLGTALSAWLGWLWAGRAIAPVRRLAQLVETLEPSRRGANRLAVGFAVDEVGTLAQAFDRYQEKLHDYVRRERAFTADASHELRTPLAVIRGAIEVMLDDDGRTPAEETRLKRMQRGSDELRDLLDALLVLARSDEEEALSGHTPDLDARVAHLLAERADALREKGLSVQHTGVADIGVAAPPRVLDVVVGNLLRAATQFAEGGELRVDVAPTCVRIAYRQALGRDSTPVPRRGGDDRADRVLGLSMIRRVCERWGWILDERAGGDEGRSFSLQIAPPPAG